MNLRVLAVCLAVCVASLASLPLRAADAPAPAKPAPAAPPPAAPAAPAAPPAAAPKGAAVPPLPYLALVPLTPVGTPPAPPHVGGLFAVALEQAALASSGLNVVSQGAQAEILEDLGRKGGDPLDEPTARRLAQLTGASHVVFGTYEAAGANVTLKLRTFGVLTGAARDLVTATGTLPVALEAAAAALARDVAVTDLGTPVVPATDKAQKAYVLCAAQAAVALERVAVKGRQSATPKPVVAACKDASADKAVPSGAGAALTVRVLSGDAKALPALEAHVAGQPRDRTGSLALVRALLDADRFDDADKVLATLRAARPRDPDVLRLWGESEGQKDAWDKARNAFQQAVNEAPNSPYLRYRLSYASYRADAPQDALDHARAALRLSGGEAPFYQLNLGERLLDAGQLDEAVLQLQRSHQANPDRLTPAVRLGYALMRSGNTDGALQVLSTAEGLKPTEREKDRGVDTLLLLDLARAHALKGNAKDAVKYLEKLRKAGTLEPADLSAPEFESIRAQPAFKKLQK